MINILISHTNYLVKYSFKIETYISANIFIADQWLP